MKITLAQAKTELARFAGQGMCSTDPRLTDKINEAVGRLMQKACFKNLVHCVRLCVSGGGVTLPRDIEKILKARIDGEFSSVFSKWYEYLSTGPGILEDGYGDYVDLIERCESPTQYDVPYPVQLMVISDKEEDENATILIRGYDETNREIFSDDNVPGEEIQISNTIGYYSKNKFSIIKSVHKPVTNGNIFLMTYRWDPDTRELWRDHLSTYHPDETLPSYRRYVLQTYDESDGTPIYQRLNALVKLRHVPASRDTDILQIESMSAIKAMMQSIRFSDAGDLKNAVQYESAAEKILLEQLSDSINTNAQIDVQVEGSGMGEIDVV